MGPMEEKCLCEACESEEKRSRPIENPEDYIYGYNNGGEDACDLIRKLYEMTDEEREEAFGIDSVRDILGTLDLKELSDRYVCWRDEKACDDLVRDFHQTISREIECLAEAMRYSHEHALHSVTVDYTAEEGKLKINIKYGKVKGE